MRRTPWLVAAALCLAVSTSSSVAQPNRSSYDPSAPRAASKPPDSFVDFTLKRINPSDRDYGQCLDESRTILLDETIKNSYFWSNLVALGLLGCLFIIIIYQHRIHRRREWTMSEMLAQYEQALARSNGQIEEAAKRNRSLTESLAALKQSTLRSQPLPADAAERTPCRPTRSHTASIQVHAAAAPKGDGVKPIVDRPPNVAPATNPGGQIALFKPEVELVAKVNALEQQLRRSHELEKQLRRQLNESGRKFQAEQEKNRSLKGE